MRAARDLELAALYMARNYIRAAREADDSWCDIGTDMELGLDGGAWQADETMARAAYPYAAGNSDTDLARRHGRSFAWTCASCEGLIIEHGTRRGPADDERGHARGCLRHAAAVAEWEAGRATP